MVENKIAGIKIKQAVEYVSGLNLKLEKNYLLKYLIEKEFPKSEKAVKIAS